MSEANDGARHEAPNRGELASGLAGLRQQAGLPATEDEALQAKVVKVSLPIDDVCNKIASYLRTGEYGIYRRGQDIGTIDEETGAWESMDARDFRTWLPDSCGIIPIEKFVKAPPRDDDPDAKPVWKPVKGELTLDQAATILRSRALRTKIPVVEHIHRVKLPVFRDEVDEQGRRKIELLQPGYDAPSRTFTVTGAHDYDEAKDPNEGMKHLQRLLRYFPWADATPERVSGRSVAIQVCAMMTLFGARMYRGRSPLFLWNANMPDSGKSRLAQLAVQPVHGHAGRAGFSYNDKKEVKQELDACAQIFGPYIFFDDLPRGKVASEDLHRWLTAPEWSCRILGTKDRFQGPLYAATLMTGNEIRLGEDLERRTLQLDLFARVAGRDRVLPDDAVILDDDFFASEESMGEVLASLWSLIRWWDDNARPKTRSRPLNSFEGWSRVIPAIVECAGFGNALAPFDAPDSGNDEGRELRKLMLLVLKELVVPRPADWPADEDHVTMVPLSKVTAIARRERFFQERLMTIEAVLATEEEKGGFKFKKPASMSDYEQRASAELQKTVPHPDVYEVQDAAERLARREQAAEWHGSKVGSWWGKFFKKRAANGLFWRAENGEVYEVGSRDNNDLSKVELRHKAPKR